MKDETQKSIFSHNLNRLLAQTDKTQKDVADAIGVSPQTFNTWIQGIAIPRMGKVQALADYFQVPKSYLIDRWDKTSEDIVLASYLEDDKIRELVMCAGGILPKENRDQFINAFINTYKAAMEISGNKA